jgi:hypothetical protein
VVDASPMFRRCSVLAQFMLISHLSHADPTQPQPAQPNALTGHTETFYAHGQVLIDNTGRDQC